MKKGRVQNTFLDELREVPIIQVACKRTGISRKSVYQWRHKDPDFASRMDTALSEGEELINDLAESQVLVLIKEGRFSAIHFWLTTHHSKYKKQEKITKTNDGPDPDVIIKELGLTDEDFSDEKRDDTAKRISNYLRAQ